MRRFTESYFELSTFDKSVNSKTSEWKIGGCAHCFKNGKKVP